MHIAIVDDTASDSNILASYIEKYNKATLTSVDVSQYFSGENFLELADIEHLEIVFLDIVMENITGIDVARAIRNKNADCIIIFISTSNAFASESYSVKALQYLSKPYTYDQFESVMIQIVKNLNETLMFIEVMSKRELRRIYLEDITYLDYFNHCVQIHVDGDVIKTYAIGFADIQNELLLRDNFLCCYKNIVVNMDSIIKLEDKGFLMPDGVSLPISRKNYNSVKKQYMDYIFDKLRS